MTRIACLCTLHRRVVAHRRGVTLLEVLISVMVMSIGLLGLASLLPVGRLEIARANQAMRAGSIGRTGFRDLSIRNALSPQRWLYFKGNTPIQVVGVLDPVSFQLAFNASVTGGGPGTPVSLPYTPMVIDPLMTAMNLNNGVPTSTMVSQFPCATKLPAAVTLPRITLSSVPGTLVPMSAGSADLMCRSTDDMSFNLPLGAKSRPQATFLFLPAANNTGALNPSKRVSNGDISWFATVSLDLFQAMGASAMIPRSPVGNPLAGANVQAMGGANMVHQYQITVAACYKRDLSDLNATLGTDIPPERSASVAFASSGATPAGSSTFSTSEAFLSMPAAMSQSDAEKYLNMQPEQWIMIVGNTTNSLSGTPRPQLVMNWYRVVGAASNVDNFTGVAGLSPGNWARAVRLDGPDWDVNWANPTAMIVDGVFGVFQKTVVSDNGSVWSF